MNLPQGGGEGDKMVVLIMCPKEKSSQGATFAKKQIFECFRNKYGG